MFYIRLLLLKKKAKKPKSENPNSNQSDTIQFSIKKEFFNVYFFSFSIKQKGMVIPYKDIFGNEPYKVFHSYNFTNWEKHRIFKQNPIVSRVYFNLSKKAFKCNEL